MPGVPGVNGYEVPGAPFVPGARFVPDAPFEPGARLVPGALGVAGAAVPGVTRQLAVARHRRTYRASSDRCFWCHTYRKRCGIEMWTKARWTEELWSKTILV